MTGNKAGISPQRPEFVLDGIQQRRVISAGKIAAAYGVPEQHIANPGQLGRRGKEYQVAWCMARAMNHLKL